MSPRRLRYSAGVVFRSEKARLLAVVSGAVCILSRRGAKGDDQWPNAYAAAKNTGTGTFVVVRLPVRTIFVTTAGKK